MKIIIAYASVGSGHRQAAEAIYNYFKEHKPNVNLAITDALARTNVLYRKIYSYGYLFLVRHALWLWRLSFWFTHLSCLRPINRFSGFIIHRLNTKRFADYLIREKPDYIIATHFLPAEVASYLKRKQKINSKLITVITDFGVHHFWITPQADSYIVASDFTKQELLWEGVSGERIQVFGIPIHCKFLIPYQKHAIRKKFGIKEDKFTVLIITGSFGIGPIEKIVGLIYRHTQVLVVCARNKKLYTRLIHQNYPDVLVFEFVDYVQELMAASDIIITKPGGLSIAEVLAMELPPIFISPIPGQETLNIEALAEYGIGYSTKSAREAKNIVLGYKNSPEKLNKARERIRAIKKPAAAKELCDVICSGSIRLGR